jgi:hypothetical protein
MTIPNFGQLFIESKGQPIVFGGRTLIMLDRLPAEFNQRFTVTIESTHSQYPQGVGISEGIEVFGERVKRAVVWEYFSLPPENRNDTKSNLPFSFDVVCRNKKGSLTFYNMTEFKGRQEWWHGGSCMIATDIPGGRRYLCNDFELDDDFNDLVFTVIAKNTA